MTAKCNRNIMIFYNFKSLRGEKRRDCRGKRRGRGGSRIRREEAFGYVWQKTGEGRADGANAIRFPGKFLPGALLALKI